MRQIKAKKTIFFPDIFMLFVWQIEEYADTYIYVHILYTYIYTYIYFS